MINYLIVDDEPQARKLLLTYLQEVPTLRLVKTCSNAMEAYEALQTSQVDLMFLDIKMPLVSGTNFLRSLKNSPLVIFTTAFNKYAIEGYELNVIDYLLKPIAMPRLLAAIEKAKERLTISKNPVVEHKTDYLYIKTDNKLVKVSFSEIILVEGMQNYVKLHLHDRILIATYTMKALEAILPKRLFLRVHRSYIISNASILAINGNIVETNYQNIQIGVSFKAAVMEHVNQSN
jgi:DNA-binding LytR/AlgR family response regulator